ncbi:hypothetical protein ILYODFUR_027614 [Ilyodon furcidens]|uniref:Uncharacterized protein n=1 Tax=Ilyodon furcidens TaxID=33524 RepID=A0ABV0T1U2_9TELE
MTIFTGVLPTVRTFPPETWIQSEGTLTYKGNLQHRFSANSLDYSMTGSPGPYSSCWVTEVLCPQSGIPVAFLG